MASFRHVRSTQMCCTNWKNALAWLLLLWLCTPAKCSESFSYSKVNNGEPTNLVCVVSGVPPPPAGNISVVSTVGGGEGLFFQGTIVTGSTRAVSYQVNVLLDEVPQNFSCLVHRPDGSIVSKDLSVSVYEPPWFSFNEANILVGETSSDSITISWRPWNETHDNGDGPVIGYRVYYNIHGENNLQRASIDIITGTVFTITNLTRDTEYDFRVTAVRQGRGGDGTHSSIASSSTRCSAPSEAPVLIVSNTGPTSISLSWELISEDSWGCRTLAGIQITLGKDEQIEFQRNFSATSTSAIISGLEVCTRYSIRAAFNNKDEFGFRSTTLSASTSMTTPERIVGLQASRSATQIEVSWEISTTPCPPDYYIIRYSLYQKLACPLLETISTEFEVNTTSPQHNNLADLEPYSRYYISVTAVNGAGRSEPAISYASTSPGPSPTITDVMVDQERTSPTSIGFTWQPLTCKNVNGPFRYYYTRIYKDGDRTASPAGREYFHNRTSSSVEFDNLEPCTMYELNIYAVSSGVAGEVSRAIGVTGVSFTGASVYARGDQPSLTVFWNVPSRCNVDYYKLSYQLISRKACPDVPVIDAPRYELNITSVLTTKRLSNLEYYSTYAISIIAVISGAESLPTNVSGDTGEGVPSPLQSVSYTSTDESLHFMWEDPSCENRHGIFRGYNYELYNIDEGRSISSVFNTLVNDAEIYNLDACTRYRFSVRVVTTSNRRSAWHMEYVLTNISAPGMPSMTQLTQLQDEVDGIGLTVSWQPPTWPRCQPTYYEIQYYLRQGDSCENIPSDPQLILAGAVDGTNFTFQIDMLRPNSDYMVFLRGNTTSGYGDWDSRAGTTGYSYPSGAPTNIRSPVIKKRSIVFTWEKPECGNRNGPITHYDVMLYNSTGFIVHQENVTADQILDYEISDLIPYSDYSIMIRAWNNEQAGVYSQEVWAQTDEARPGPPIGVILPSSDLESITVEWMSPNPPLGRIIRYYILYWETDAANTTPRNISVPCPDGRCSDINYRFSEIIPDLQSETNYSIQVQAETILGAGAPSPSEPAVTITSEGSICQNISWVSPRFGNVNFPVGENGTWANSTGQCPFNTTRAYQPVGRALCTGDGIMQSQWLPMDNCGPFRDVTHLITEIAKVNVTEENAGEVSEQLSVVTTNTEQITSDDITFAAEITARIAQQNLTSEEVTESITSIVSNIALADKEELEAAEEEAGSISQFVQAFQEQISRVTVADGESLRIQRPNVAVQVQSVPADDIMTGLVLSVAGSNHSDLTELNITINAPTRDDVTTTRPNVITQVNIPPSVSSAISSTSSVSRPAAKDYVRVNFHIFSTPVLFISRSLRNISAANEDFNRSANSPVIALSLGEGKVAALTDPINFTFTTIMSGYKNPLCSFWDENKQDWSQEGCSLISSSGITSSDENYNDFRRDGFPAGKVLCACDHLTNFAVLMDIYRQRDALQEAYSTLTYIGCGISIFSLLVTLATYLWYKDLRTKQTNKIFICLCLNLLCLYTTFIIMISLDSIRDYREVQPGPCGFLTALIHYFVLSSIAWMGVEGFNTYLVIVKVFNTYIPKFMMKAVIAAWGVPALIVILTGALARDFYAHDDLCFLQFWAQIGGLLIPMSIILLINIITFIMVVRRLIRSANMTGRVRKGAEEERRETVQRVQNAVCMMVLLGLTWVTGYLLLIPTFSQVAQPIFIILNSFQGMFIFMLYCVRKPHIRARWGLTCCDSFLDGETSSSSGIPGSAVPSSSTAPISILPAPSDSDLLPAKDDHSNQMYMFKMTFDVDEAGEDQGTKE